jgi:molybdate transport system ATP-binding protein
MQSPRLTVNIQKQLGAFRLNIELTASSEILVLFGPSGAGKTQTLNAIAGLSKPDSGEIALDGEPFFRKKTPTDLIDVPARVRRVGYVFQQYALFPHLSALQNVAYPLWRKANARSRAMALLERMRLSDHADRYPHEMSGGQQQRVAIARALAAEPRVLLLDEPFSALDAAIRERLHEDLRSVQAESGLVVLYVTHNLDDALSVGHRLAVVLDGRVEQVGSVADVYLRPATSAAMEVLGISNPLAALVEQNNPDELILHWEGLSLRAAPFSIKTGAAVLAYLLPDQIKLRRADTQALPCGNNRIRGRVTGTRFGRNFRFVRIALANGCIIEAHLPLSSPQTSLEASAEVEVEIPPQAIIVVRSA